MAEDFNKNWRRTLEARIKSGAGVKVEARGWSVPMVGVPIELRTGEYPEALKLQIGPGRFTVVVLPKITNVEAVD